MPHMTYVNTGSEQLQVNEIAVPRENTRRIGELNGRRYTEIVYDSGGYQDYLNQPFAIVRYDCGGKQIILDLSNTEKREDIL